MAYEPRNTQIMLTMTKTEYEWAQKLAARQNLRASTWAYHMFRRQLLIEAKSLTAKEPPA